MTTALQVEYPLSQLPDDTLAGLYSAAATVWREHAPALAYCICTICKSEALRRNANRTGNDPQDAGDGFMIDLDQWSDRDVAEGLRLASGISIETTDPTLSELSTELCKSMTVAAHHRLATSGDPRNATPYEERHQR